MSGSAYDNMYDYFGLDPIFDELNSIGRQNKDRLEALPAPDGDPDPDRLERAFVEPADALDAEPIVVGGPAPVPTFSVDDWDAPFPDYSVD